jgi:FkbM family methyltransferase
LRFHLQFFKDRIQEGLPHRAEKSARSNGGGGAYMRSEPAGPVDVSSLLPIRGDEDFIKEAYRQILGREADIVGFVNYREMIRRHVPRRQILRTLAHSPEAKQTGRQFVNVPAHQWAGADAASRLLEACRYLYRGIAFRAKHLVRIVFLEPVEVLEHKVDYLLEEVENRFDQISTKVDSALWTISQKLDTQSAQQTELQKSNVRGIAGLAAKVETFEHNLSLLTNRVDFQGGNMKSLADHSARLTARLDAANAALEAVQRSMRSPILSGGDVFFTEADGFIIGVPGEEKRLAAYFGFRGVPEPGLVKRFSQTVRPGMVVIDIGAHIGLYTLYAARLLAGQGKIYSFEPTPRSFELLQDNVQVNGFLESGVVAMRRMAVSDRPGYSSFTTYPRNSGHNTFFGDETGGETMTVETVTIDEQLANEPKVDVVKIDAEGAEPLILRGMTETIARNPGIWIFLEFAPVHLRRAGVDPRCFLEQIRSMGMKLHRVDDVTGELTPCRDQELCECFSANLSVHR